MRKKKMTVELIGGGRMDGHRVTVMRNVRTLCYSIGKFVYVYHVMDESHSRKVKRAMFGGW